MYYVRNLISYNKWRKWILYVDLTYEAAKSLLLKAAVGPLRNNKDNPYYSVCGTRGGILKDEKTLELKV